MKTMFIVLMGFYVQEIKQFKKKIYFQIFTKYKYEKEVKYVNSKE